MDWEPVWALPNVELDEPVNSEHFALVPPNDARIRRLKRDHPEFRTFMRRFKDSHGVRFLPTIVIRCVEVPESFRAVDAAASFRDLLVASIVPVERSLQIIHDNQIDRVIFSSFLWAYPWIISRDYEHLVMNTPAVLAIHDLEYFAGQSSPELSRVTLRRRRFDEPLLQELLLRWKTRYETSDPKWSDVALFRSLNMVNRACLLPAGADAVIHDYGRIAGLWVAAMEMLVHPGGSGQSNANKVFKLLQGIHWVHKKCGYRRFAIRIGGKREWKHIASWLYNYLYWCRNDFMHGNPVDAKSLVLPPSGREITFLAAPLYRLALSSFLNLTWNEDPPPDDNAEDVVEYYCRKRDYYDPQIKCEEAIMLSRVSVDEQRELQARRVEAARARAQQRN